jgi:hypothetical protein
MSVTCSMETEEGKTEKAETVLPGVMTGAASS